MTRRANILAPQCAGVLRAFAASNVALAFDYDGSLAPIASAPERARIRTVTRRLLVSVAERYPCVVVSGRRLHDLAPRLEGIPLRMVFGNFGYEPAPAGRHPPADVATWVAALTRRLPLQEGLVIEDKQYSVAIHFRHARRQREARRAISSAVRGLHGVRVLSGTKTVTLLPQGGPDKGAALQSAPQGAGMRHRDLRG